MKKLFRDKKNRRRNLALVLIPLIVLVVIFGILAFNSAKGIVSSISGSSSYSNSIESYDYHLRNNPTDLQKQLFSDLKDECNKSEPDEKEIAVLVCKNFVADFYTWSNKNGTTDVGGMEYIHKPTRRYVLLQARRYIYQHLNEYIEQYGSDKLLEVENINVTWADKSSIEINGKTYDSYNIGLNWSYKAKSGGFDTSKYAKSSGFTVYKNDDGRFEILDVME